MPVTKLSDDVTLDPGPAATRLPPDAKLDAGPSALSRVGMGMMDPIYGGAQIGARMIEEGSNMPLDPARAEDVDRTVRQREESYQAGRKADGQSGTDWWRILGNVVSPPNLALAAVPGGAVTLPARIGLGAATGAASAAISPATSGDYWSEKTKQIAVGLGLGGAVPAVAAGVGRAIAPTMGADAKALSDAGVSLTPGQMAGSWLRRPEEAAKSLPVLGSFIRGSEGRGIESFNTSVINQALEPIGLVLPKGMKAGREAVDYAAEKYSDAYETLLPTMTFHVDQPFAEGMSNLRSLTSEMPPGQATQFENIIQNRLFGRLGAEGNMDGSTLKQVESEIGFMAGNYRSSSDAAQRQLASALDETRSLIRQALARQNPDGAQQLQAINAGYAMLTRIEAASGRRLGSQGVFTPMDLLAAVRAGDRSARHRDFAHGDALMQAFAETGQRVLSKELPDSGTTERALWDGVIKGLAGLGVAGGAAGHGVGLPAAAAVGGLVAPYTKMGGKAMQQYMSPGTMRQAIGGGLEDMGIYGSPAATALGIDVSGR